ncbi:MAG: nitroreductase family protein [Clostridium sp.]
MDFRDLIKKRESIRGYRDEKVERDKIEICIEAARLAPSACNSQPWRFIAVDNETKVREMAKLIYDPLAGGINKFALTSPCFIVIIGQKRNIASSIGELLKHKDYTSIDIGIATEHICLQATDIGLGTCIIGWFKEEKIKNILNIPKSSRIELIVSLGYYENKVVRNKVRKKLSDILVYNDHNCE